MSTNWSKATEAPTFPAYLQNAHHDWLSGDRPGHSYAWNMRDMLEQALAEGSPYEDLTAYDPNADLDASETDIAGLTPIGTDDYWTTPLTAYAAATDAVGTAGIDGLVDAFEAKTKRSRDADLNAYCGSMFEGRATDASNFAVGLALIYADHKRGVDEYRAQLESQAEQRKTMVAVSLLDGYQRARAAEFESERAKALAAMDVRIRRIVANKDYLNDQASIAEADRTYELDLFRYGENMLHALSGVTANPARLPKGASGLAGMLSGAGTAVSVGTAIAGVTNPAIGIGVGLLSVLMSGAVGQAQGYST